MSLPLFNILRLYGRAVLACLLILIFIADFASATVVDESQSTHFNISHTNKVYGFHQLSQEEILHIAKMNFPITTRFSPKELEELTYNDVILLSEHKKVVPLTRSLLKLDETIRRLYPHATAGIPLPQLVVVRALPKKGLSTNAFVPGFPVAVDVPLIWSLNLALQHGIHIPSFKEYSKTIAKTERFVTYYPGYLKPAQNGRLGSSKFVGTALNQTKSLFIKPNLVTLNEIIKDINERAFNTAETPCQLGIDNSSFEHPILVPSQDCIKPAFHFVMLGTKGVVYNATGNTVFVDESLIDLNTSTSLHGVIAHELAHYYLRHIGSDKKVFYRVADKANLGKPVFSQDLYRLGNTLEKFSSPGVDNRSYSFDPIGYWPAKLLKTVLLGDFCTEPGECTEACTLALKGSLKNIESKYSKDLQKEALDIFGSEYLLDEYKPLIKAEASQLEREVKACSESIRFFETNDFESAKKAYADSRTTTNKPFRKRHFSNFHESWEGQSMPTAFSYLNSCIPKPNSAPANLWEWLLYYKHRLKDSGCLNQRRLFEDSSNQGLSVYHDEQEADEFALMILDATIGYSSNYLLEYFEARAAQNGDPLCKNWEAKQTKKTFPAPEDYSSTHHDTCFRRHTILQAIEQLR